jgi:hypothetical protein
MRRQGAPVIAAIPPNPDGGLYVSMDACGGNRDTDLRLFFSGDG